jgi:flagellar motor switch protein FliM
MTVQAYNFKRPGRLPPEAEGRLAAWLRAAGSLAVTRWAKQAPFALEIRLQGMEPAYSKDALAAYDETDVGYQVLGPRGAWNSLLALPRPLVLALEAGLMGETPAQLPADHELTVVEESLCEYLLQEIFVRPLQETWPEPEGITLQLGPKEPNLRWSRLFASSVPLVECRFALKGPFGEQTWNWLLPQSAVLPEGKTHPGADEPTLDEDSRRARLEGLVLEMPVEIAVTLGAVHVPLTDLGKLQVGDVLVLDQRVCDPVAVSVGGGPMVLGWPGRVGDLQALQIETFGER